MVSHGLTACFSVLNLLLTQLIMPIVSKGCEPDTVNLNQLSFKKLSFKNIQGLSSNSTDCESFLESKSTNIFLKIEIHSMQVWTASTKYGVTRKRSSKRVKHTENLFRKNIQVKSVC